VLVLISADLYCQIPQTLSYQGLLTNSTGDNAGLPIADGDYKVKFNFYTTATGGTMVDSRMVTVSTYQGLFTAIIGNGETDNQPLNTLNPPLGAAQYYVGLQVEGAPELVPRVALTSVPYSFSAGTAYSLSTSATVSGSQLNSPITNPAVTFPSSQLAGTLSTALIEPGSIDNSKLASGIDISKITNGILPSSLIGNASIADDKIIGLSATKLTGTLGTNQYGDGTITNAKLASGIDIGKITTGILPSSLIGNASIADDKIIGLSATKLTGTLGTNQYGDGTVTNAKLASGIDIGKITTGILPSSLIGNASITDDKINGLSATKLTGALGTDQYGDGTITNAKLASGIDIGKITTGILPSSLIGNASLTDDKIIGLSATKLSGTLGTDQYGDGTVTNAKLASGIEANKITTGTLPLERLGGIILTPGPTSSRPSSASAGALRYNSDDNKMEYYNGSNWYYITPKIALLKDTAPSGINGGSSATGWQSRNLNILEGDNSFVTLLNNQFTLSSGEYIIEASSPGISTDQQRIALVNANNLTDVYYGTSEYNPSTGASQSRSFLVATLPFENSARIFTIKMYVQTPLTNQGLGKASSVPPLDGTIAPNELYTVVKIIKLR
jgi:hypothetical protein